MIITKVYTRRGDNCETDLVGGIRISKTAPRLEAYGTIDELNSHLGLLVAMLPNPADIDHQLLERVQHILFNVGTYLATDLTQTPLYASARMPADATTMLEERIDAINDELPVQQGFILPGGSVAAAEAHVARTVCRRAERTIAVLAQTDEVSPAVTQFINRLSDYLFVLAKKINFSAGRSEILWQNPCR